MKLCLFFNGALLLLIPLTSGASTVSESHMSHTVEERACDELRHELATLLSIVYERKAWPNNLKKLLPDWVESYMPANCGKRRRSRKHKHQTADTHGALAKSSKNRHAPEAIDHSFKNQAARHKRSILAAAEEQLRTILRHRRSPGGADAASQIYGSSAAMSRQKRFLSTAVAAPDFSSMTLGSVNPGPAREISESAQMMNSLLMLTKLQKNNVAREFRNIGGNTYVGDRVSFGSGVYGDTYPAKKKRELNYYNEAGMGQDALSEPSLRRKRFLVQMEPAEILQTPSLFSIYQGTAIDPNTGKRLEFSGDVMRNAFGSTLMSFLPPGFRPPPGTEPGDYINNIAPLLLNNQASPGSAKSRNPNGLFGDALPGKKRKRSPDDSTVDVFKFAGMSDLFGRKGLARF